MFEKNPSNIFQITTKVVYGCKRGLYSRIFHCRIVIHATCFDELEEMDESVRKVRERINKSISNGTMMTLLAEQNMHCHHSLKDLQVHRDGEWWQLKNIASIQA